MPDKDDNFYGNYQKYKRDALDLYQQQALAPDDFKKAMEEPEEKPKTGQDNGK